MSAKANQAVCTLNRLAAFDLRTFAKNRREMIKLEDSYFRYSELARQDLQHRESIRRRYGLLGVHFPKVSPELAKELSPLDKVNSSEVWEELKTWEVLQEFLLAAGESTYPDFCSFLRFLSHSEPSSQNFDSAVKTHPNIFEERSEGRQRLIGLKSMI